MTATFQVRFYFKCERVWRRAAPGPGHWVGQQARVAEVELALHPGFPRHASRQRRLVVKAGSLRLRPPAQTHFAALGRVVVCQRRVGAAAAVIDGRLIAALGGELAPRRVLSLPTGGSVLPTCPSI